MTSLKINLKFLEMEWQSSDPDKPAAWEMYIELLTRITTQPLAAQTGDEQAALNSVYSLFPTTVVVLNQIVRPFTARWYSPALAGALQDGQQRQQSRAELAVVKEQLKKYTGMLADMAGVEDLY